MLRARRTALVLCLAAVVLPGAAAARPASPRIVGGGATSNPGWIAFLHVQFPDGTAGLCGGSLVAKDAVLTAAHCITDDQGNALTPPNVRVWVGLDRLTQATNANASSVSEVFKDPAYGTTLTGDVGVVRLSTPVAGTPVALGPDADPAVGSVPVVLGWGLTSNASTAQPSPAPSDTLQQVAAPVLDPSRCSFWNAFGISFDPSSMICAGAAAGQDSCAGDSGGPLAFSPATAVAELVGTVDYGSDTCGDGTPAVYQRLTSGPVAGWLAGTIPQAQISLSSAQPHHDSTVTATASSTGVPDASYGWDLNGDGQFTDASGPSVQIPVGTDPVGIAVRATGSDGQLVARRATIVPLFATVQATAPAQVTEGQPLVLSLTRIGNGAGQVTAVAGGQSVRVDVPPASSLTVPLPDDHIWQPPRRLAIALSADGDLQLTSARDVQVEVLDDDKPAIGIRRVRQRSPRVLAVTVAPPGAGVVTLRADSHGRRVATRRFNVALRAPRTVQLRITAAARRRLAGRRPVVHVSWQSSVQTSARASATRTGPRLR
jgi:secreted trypsin-like serine protease